MRIALLGLLLATPISTLPGQDTKIPYADHGRAFLKDLGEGGAPELNALLDRHYARLLLGDFDVRLPSGMLGKKSDVALIVEISNALLDLQDRLAEWTIGDAVARKAGRAETATLQKQLASWRSNPVVPLPGIAARQEPCLLLIAPTRKDFVGLVGWLGLWKQQYQDYWWIDATAQFSDLRLPDEGHVQIVALEYAAPDQNGDVTLGYAMDTREKTGLLQHVVQRAAVSWCFRAFGEQADTAFVLGFATDLVIDVLGQNNARSGGSGKSQSTAGQGGFIPGAPGAGGGMPVQNADSNWRHSLGHDYFARPLRQAQKAGVHEAENSKDKLGHFLLRDAKGEQKHLVHAPFLGAVAFDCEVVPAAFVDDYLEFHRSYRAAFVHWLQTSGGKTKTGSKERFGALMLRLMAKPENVTFEALMREVYGIALADQSPQADTLERRFLAAIADGSV